MVLADQTVRLGLRLAEQGNRRVWTPPQPKHAGELVQVEPNICMFWAVQRTVDRQRFTEEPLRLVEVALLSRHHGEITEIAAHCRMPLPECPSVKRKGFADERIRFLGPRRSMKEHLPQPVEAARYGGMGRPQ